jgi:hypothetical protein
VHPVSAIASRQPWHSGHAGLGAGKWRAFQPAQRTVRAPGAGWPARAGAGQRMPRCSDAARPPAVPGGCLAAAHASAVCCALQTAGSAEQRNFCSQDGWPVQAGAPGARAGRPGAPASQPGGHVHANAVSHGPCPREQLGHWPAPAPRQPAPPHRRLHVLSCGCAGSDPAAPARRRLSGAGRTHPECAQGCALRVTPRGARPPHSSRRPRRLDAARAHQQSQQQPCGGI